MKSRKVAILATDGVNAAEVTAMQAALNKAGAHAEVVAPHFGALDGGPGGQVPVDKSLLTTASVMYDAVYVPGGRTSVEALQSNSGAAHFVQEAYDHRKPIAASGEGTDLLHTAGIPAAPGVVSAESGAKVAEPFMQAISQHRHWDRPKLLVQSAQVLPTQQSPR